MFDRVLIERAEALTKTRGGIVIPEKAQQKVLKGTVVAVGPGSRTDVRLILIETIVKLSNDFFLLS
jgi:co-chaperonin GroES (HSP10)